MSKPILVFQSPIATRSGYGDHSRDLLKSLMKMDRFDIKIVPTRWGNTPQNQLDPNTDFGKFVLSNIITTLDRKPDVFVQVSVANEFKPIGEYNIGITAGVETTGVPRDFIDGCNLMDLIIVPSEFTKTTFENTGYNEVDNNTKQLIRVLKLEKPIEILHEGTDISVFDKIRWL